MKRTLLGTFGYLIEGTGFGMIICENKDGGYIFLLGLFMVSAQSLFFDKPVKKSE